MQTHDYIAAALEYLRLGISVIPIGSHGNGKQPAIKEWKTYQTTLPTENELREWFSRDGLAVLAIIFGPVSGGVYARDYDNTAAYRFWAKEHPHLASTLPTVITGRGYHVYFRNASPLRTRNCADGEIRGCRSYCLAPPSQHPSGVMYEWKVPITGENLLTIEEPYTVFTEDETDTESTEEIEEIDEIESIEDIDEIDDNRSGVFVVGCVLSENEINAIVQLALPNEQNANHHHLFVLARAIKTQERKQGERCSEELLKQIFEVWYAKNQSNLRADQTKYDYYLEFEDAYKRARYGLGEGIFDDAWETAKKSPPPAIALKLYDEQQMRFLISLCRELQREAGDNPFFLAYSKVTELFNLPNNTVAGRRLNDLVKRGVITVVEKHTPSRAARYRYLHRLDDDRSLMSLQGAHREVQPERQIANVVYLEVGDDGEDII